MSCRMTCLPHQIATISRLALPNSNKPIKCKWEIPHGRVGQRSHQGQPGVSWRGSRGSGGGELRRGLWWELTEEQPGQIERLDLCVHSGIVGSW